jgi:tetratricopeptide (TPR) repeat protein
VSLPRETLVRITGDCDDLTALYASLLESLGIETAFITTPGHIYVAFNTGVSAQDYAQVHPDRDMSLVVDGELWVPVEITLIGRDPFLGAWREGVSEWNEHSETPAVRGFYKTREAQSVYRPVGLREQDLGLQYGDATRISEAFAGQRDLLADLMLNDLRSAALSEQAARAWNEYGIAAAQLNRLTLARTAFERVAALRPESLSPAINLGSVSYLLGDYPRALAQYQSAKRLLERRDRSTDSGAMAAVLLNISRSHYALAQYDLATSTYEQAAALDPQQVESFAYLANAEQEGARASSARSGPQILFIEEEE